jgi:hypothetical protein
MFKTVLTVAALVALPVAAHAEATEEARNFSHEGVNYVYTTEQQGDVTVIEGKAAGAVPFRLYVSGNRVTGSYNNRTVAFRVQDAKQALVTAR